MQKLHLALFSLLILGSTKFCLAMEGSLPLVETAAAVIAETAAETVAVVAEATIVETAIVAETTAAVAEAVVVGAVAEGVSPESTKNICPLSLLKSITSWAYENKLVSGSLVALTVYVMYKKCPWFRKLIGLDDQKPRPLFDIEE